MKAPWGGLGWGKPRPSAAYCPTQFLVHEPGDCSECVVNITAGLCGALVAKIINPDWSFAFGGGRVHVSVGPESVMELPLLVNMARFCAWLLTDYFETSLISVPKGQRERLWAWTSPSSRCVGPAPESLWIEVV
jgi:hypothetical protein